MNETDKLCRNCGATNINLADWCWLCKQPLDDQSRLVVADVVSEPPAFAQDEHARLVTTAVMAGVLVVLGIGIAASMGPGLTILYAITVFPAFTATVIRVQLKSRRKRVTPLDQVLTFFLSTITVVGALAILCVAAFVAFVVYCLAQLSQQGGAM